MRVITVEPVIFAYVFALAMAAPLLQQYIYDELSEHYNFTKHEDKICKDSSVSDNITTLENLVQTQSSHWFIGLSLSSSLPSLFATFMYGSMSDATGRKPLLVVALCGAFVRFIIVSLTVTFGWPFYFIFLGSFIEGLTGSFGTIAGLCLAYIIDSTDDNARSIRLGVLEMSIIFAAMASFLCSGIWLKHSGYMPPLWAGTILLFLVCLYAVFLLPESLKEKQSFNKFSCLANAKRIKEFVLTNRGPYVNVCLALLFISFLFAVFDYFGSITILFTKHYPLCWGPEMIGYYMATKTALAGVGIPFVFKVLTKCIMETLIVIISCVCYIISNVIVGLSKTTVAMFMSCIPAILAVAAPPCIRSIASKMVGRHEEGTLCSIIAVTETIAQIVSPVTLNLLYPVGLNKLHLPGFAFFVQAGVLCIPIVLFSVIHYLSSRSGLELYAKMPEFTEENKVQVST